MEELTYKSRKDICSKFFQMAKEKMQEYGSQPTTMFILDSNLKPLFFPNTEKLLGKYEYAEMASSIAKEIEAKAIIYISEIYISTLNANDKRVSDSSFKPSKDPNHKEALAVILTDPYGDVCLKMNYFEKIKDKIIFGEKEKWIEHGTMNMIPPWKTTTVH
jgi:hypothetical protein